MGHGQGQVRVPLFLVLPVLSSSVSLMLLNSGRFLRRASARATPSPALEYHWSPTLLPEYWYLEKEQQGHLPSDHQIDLECTAGVGSQVMVTVVHHHFWVLLDRLVS